jgi:tetratricopeptide (TPR) repeat protein
MSFKLAYDAALKHAQSLSESGKVLQAGRRREDVLHFAHRAFGEQSLVRVLPTSICVSVRTERVHPADASRACRVRRLPDETLLKSTKCMITHLIFSHCPQEKCQAQYELALNDYDNGRYEKAVLAFSKALDLVRTLKGGGHKHLLANILVGMGNAQEARQIHAQALTFYAKARQVLEGDAGSKKDENECENECKMSENKGAQREAAPKERDEEALASVLVNIALVHIQMGDMEQAERLLRRASLLLWRGTGSALSRKDLFRRGSVAADIWHNLSCCLFARGETRQASHAMRAALRLRQKMLGERHLLTASAALDLGKLLLCEEKEHTKFAYQEREAYKLVLQAYTIFYSTLGVSHPHTLVRAQQRERKGRSVCDRVYQQ